MISVGVLASSPMMRARLEALVESRPGLRLVASPPVAAGPPRRAADVGVGPDVLLLESGAGAAEAALASLAGDPPAPPVVLLAGDLGPTACARLLRAGVRAILPRDASEREIAAGIEAAAAGLIVLHPSAAPAAGRGARLRRAGAPPVAEPLTTRELEVLGMIAEGLRNRAIAGRLGISSHTVKFHIAAILAKLGARSRTEAVTAGLRLGLLMV